MRLINRQETLKLEKHLDACLHKHHESLCHVTLYEESASMNEEVATVSS